jgi:hypothetical protein
MTVLENMVMMMVVVMVKGVILIRPALNLHQGFPTIHPFPVRKSDMKQFLKYLLPMIMKDMNVLKIIGEVMTVMSLFEVIVKEVVVDLNV